jgi:hypothetical protein
VSNCTNSISNNTREPAIIFNTAYDLIDKTDTSNEEKFDDIYADLILNLTSYTNLSLDYFIINNPPSKKNVSIYCEEKNSTRANFDKTNISLNFTIVNITTNLIDSSSSKTTTPFSNIINSTIKIKNNYSTILVNKIPIIKLSNLTTLNQTVESSDNNTSRITLIELENESSLNSGIINSTSSNMTVNITHLMTLPTNKSIIKTNITATSVKNNISLTTISMNTNVQNLNQSNYTSPSQVLVSTTENKILNESNITTQISKFETTKENEASNKISSNTTIYFSTTSFQTTYYTTSLSSVKNPTSTKVSTKKATTAKPASKTTLKKQIKSFKPASTIKNIVTNKIKTSVKPIDKNSNKTTTKVIVVQNKNIKKAKLPEKKVVTPKMNRFKRRLLEIIDIENEMEKINQPSFTNISEDQKRLFNLSTYINNTQKKITNDSLIINNMNQYELEKYDINETDFRSIHTTQISKTPTNINSNLDENNLINDAEISIYNDKKNTVLFDIRFDMTFNVSFGENKNYSIKKINDYSFKLDQNQTKINLFDDIKVTDKYIKIDQEQSTTTGTTKKVAYFEWVTGPFSQVKTYYFKFI